MAPSRNVTRLGARRADPTHGPGQNGLMRVAGWHPGVLILALTSAPERLLSLGVAFLLEGGALLFALLPVLLAFAWWTTR